MRINQYEFRQNGVEFEPNKRQLVQFATHQLAEKDKIIEELKEEIARHNYAEHTTDYWVRKNIKEKEIRKQVCDEIYNYIMDNWEKIMGRQGRYLNFGGTCLDLKEDLQKIVENGYKKE